MSLPPNSAFTPVKVVEIDRETGREWKKAGITFCENNGINWPGNAWLLTIFEAEGIDEVEPVLEQVQAAGINFNDFVAYHDGYLTEAFGFIENTDWYDDGFVEMDYQALKICEKLMDELGIKWCGWPDVPSYTLLASEEQISNLIKRLEQPIADWRAENGVVLEDSEDVED